MLSQHYQQLDQVICFPKVTLRGKLEHLFSFVELPCSHTLWAAFLTSFPAIMNWELDLMMESNLPSSLELQCTSMNKTLLRLARKSISSNTLTTTGETSRDQHSSRHRKQGSTADCLNQFKTSCTKTTYSQTSWSCSRKSTLEFQSWGSPPLF